MITKEEYFNRQILLWGEETQAQLSSKSIAIIGCGGLGSALAITLGSSGIGTLHLVDFDTVSVHNIHRQIAYTMEDEGAYKCEALGKLLKRRYERLKVSTYKEKFETFIKQEQEFDLIIDATDRFPVRASIDKYAKAQGIPWVHGSVEAFHGYVCFYDKASFDSFKISDQVPGGITPPIVVFIASLQANLALRYLAGLNVRKDELHYLYFDDLGSLNHRKFLLNEED
ncbi:MAG: thiamine biosynthesis protein ThiF [Sulfurovum sp.]|nr:MAG: thiamine biosynthesis protein ThiF [Sulfurovum sp.]